MKLELKNSRADERFVELNKIIRRGIKTWIITGRSFDLRGMVDEHVGVVGRNR